MKNNEESILRKNRKINRRLIIIYRSFASDLLFYYAISYLFLVNVKGLTTAQILFADSFYPIFKLLFQFPVTTLVQKVGKRNSIIIGNISIAIYLVFMLLLTNTFSLIIANIFCAIGFTIKGICESNILYDSLEDTAKKRENFSRLEGKANASFNFMDAATSLVTGLLYIINPYLPLILSLAITIFTIVLAFALKEVSPYQTNLEKKSTLKSELKDIKDGIIFILKSGRLKSLIFYNSIFVSIISVSLTLRRSLLNDVNVSSEYFGYIFAVLGLISSYSSIKSLKIHLKLRNKALTVIGIIYSLSLILSGLIIFANIPIEFVYFTLFITFAIQFAIKGVFYTLIKQYLNSFSNSELRLKIYSVNAIFEFITYSLVSFMCSFLLNYCSTAVTTIILGAITTILIGIILIYMKKHLGLKPEEYSEDDILLKQN